jgi:predicted RNase H-like nuclease (RuvC/YqgF family)
MTKTGMSLAVAAVVLVSLSFGGCQEEQASPEVKIHRLIAAENSQLKGENENLKGQIEQLKQQLGRCEEEKQSWKHKAEVEIKENVEGILNTAMEQNVAQRDEIERLQAEIAKLKGERTPETEGTPEQLKEKPEMPQ